MIGLENKQPRVPTEIQDSVLKIYKHFGHSTQFGKFYEECREACEGIGDVEEIADVFIMALQMYLTNVKVRNAVNGKIKRTKHRMKTGYYERENNEIQP